MGPDYGLLESDWLIMVDIISKDIHILVEVMDDNNRDFGRRNLQYVMKHPDFLRLEV